ncbi:hypothetical protein NDU88_003807 [Pleurodeles waltl]|uniref:Uncharacterized protein n=1 Tax=Pleurodeles waltl TaxID=8319 RepID=A0AAV7QAF5_PLEWA|nr:hypothetical protein NDU88_003807 [Pleurodeles waltl]
MVPGLPGQHCNDTLGPTLGSVSMCRHTLRGPAVLLAVLLGSISGTRSSYGATGWIRAALELRQHAFPSGGAEEESAQAGRRCLEMLEESGKPWRVPEEVSDGKRWER